jgi:hypothetical protein
MPSTGWPFCKSIIGMVELSLIENRNGGSAACAQAG